MSTRTAKRKRKKKKKKKKKKRMILLPVSTNRNFSEEALMSGVLLG